jgi:hypothetical protein
MIGDIQHIVVIESLLNERETGSELYNDCIKRNVEYRNSRISHKLHKVNNRKDFIEILNYYAVNSPYMPGGILLHIEMHGDENLNGLILSDGGLLTWNELVDLFRPINIKTCNKLYLSLATCNGRYLYKGVHPNDKSPYSCYISASTTVNVDEILSEYTLLFERVIEKGNLVAATNEISKEGAKFFYKDSEETFREAFQVTATTFMTDPEIKESVLREIKEQIEKEGMQIPPDLTFESVTPRVLRDTYERHKKAFDFSDCE